MGDQIVEFFLKLLDPGGWPPRWYCGKWTDFHGWLYICSDLAIWGAYFAIPLLLAQFVLKKKDIPLPTVFWLFGAFILLCGLTHLVDAMMFWWPAYRLNGLIRFGTACVSWLTVISLFKYLPMAFALKTSSQFEAELKKRKIMEASLIQAKERAEASEKVKEQFLSNMSHEIRTPMNAIIGFTHLLESAQLSNEQKEWLHAIKYSGENLLVIINDILDYSKIEAGKMVFVEHRINIAELMHSAVTMLKYKAAEKNIRLLFSADPQIPLIVLGDSVRLTQILLNLISNAVKFTEQGQVNVDVALLDETADEVNIRFAVSDTGIGIQEEHFDLIFESFTQASNHTTRKYGGTGLGLTIAKKLVEQQGGTLSVQSKINTGSTFTFILPFKKVTSIEQEQENLENETQVANIAGKSVLVVEDNQISQMLVKIWLERWYVRVTLAENGLVALNLLRNNNYDLILMDIQMPEMDGYETAAHIRTELNLQVPIIAMTAHAMQDEIDKCLIVGMTDYISKPFNSNELLSKINHYTTKN